MNKDELLGFYSQLLQQGNPFQHMNSKPVAEVEQGPVKRLARAGIKGATFGLTNQNFQPEGVGEHVAEFAGSIPSTIAATAGVGAIPGIGARLATLGPNLGRIATSGIVGGAIGGAKAVVNQDPSALITEPAWWLGGEAVGLGFGALFRKLRGSGLSVKEATKQAEKEVLQSQALARRPLGPEKDTILTDAKPVTLGSSSRRIQSETIDAEEVRTLGRKELEIGSGTIEQPESTLIGQKTDLIDTYLERRGAKLKALDKDDFDESISDAELDYTHPPSGSVIFDNRKSSPEEMGEITGLLQKDALAKQVDEILEPKPSQNIPTPLRDPIIFEKETGPFPRFVKDAGRPRTLDEFGDTSIDDAFYGRPRRMDEFGIEDVDNLADINTFSHGTFDDPLEVSKKLLKMDIDPKTGIKTYTPVDEQTNAIMDAVGMTTRDIEPPFDRFQIKAIQKPENIERLDLITKNQNLTTSKLLELSDSELENLKPDFVIQPTKFFTVEDSPLATEAKNLIRKLGFGQEEITEMEGMVDNMMKEVKGAAINKNLPESEWFRARQQLWEDLIKKRMRPC